MPRKNESSAGFTIGVYDQRLIEDNARERFGPDYGDPKDRARATQEGMIDAEGEITEKGWNQLNKDIERLEGNALKWMKQKFITVRSDGHDKHDDLVGSFWFDPTNLIQAELIELAADTGRQERIDMEDSSYSDLAHTAFDGASNFGASVLGGSITFFDVSPEDMEIIEETTLEKQRRRARGHAREMREERWIISSRSDVQTYVDNNHPDFASVDGGRTALVNEILNADHPRFGTDWSEWLESNIDSIREDAAESLPSMGEASREAKHRHSWHWISGNEYRCETCGVFGVEKTRGEITPIKSRGSEEVGEMGEEAPRRRNDSRSHSGRFPRHPEPARSFQELVREAMVQLYGDANIDWDAVDLDNYRHLSPHEAAKRIIADLKKSERTPMREASQPANEDTAHELALYTINDGDIYRRNIQPIIKNLANKIRNGTYDKEKAVQAWVYAADAGAQKYTKEYDVPGGPNGSFGAFSKADRLLAAQEIAEQYEEELQEAAGKLPALRRPKRTVHAKRSR